MSERKPEPCTCGDDDIRFEADRLPWGGPYAWYCHGCGIRGPWNDPSGARWNAMPRRGETECLYCVASGRVPLMYVPPATDDDTADALMPPQTTPDPDLPHLVTLAAHALAGARASESEVGSYWVKNAEGKIDWEAPMVPDHEGLAKQAVADARATLAELKKGRP